MKLALETHRLLRSLVAISAITIFATFAMPAKSAEIGSTGTFVGQSEHVTTGTASIEKDGDRVLLVLGKDFSLDGAPEPTIGFSKDGKFDLKTEFTQLKSNHGHQVYEIPASVDIASYDAVTVWCSKFSVPLGTAKFAH